MPQYLDQVAYTPESLAAQISGEDHTPVERLPVGLQKAPAVSAQYRPAR
jgi:hypothetical protein